MTDEGRAYARGLYDHIRRRAISVLDVLGRDDAETLIRILRKLADTVGSERTPALAEADDAEHPGIRKP